MRLSVGQVVRTMPFVQTVEQLRRGSRRENQFHGARMAEYHLAGDVPPRQQSSGDQRDRLSGRAAFKHARQGASPGFGRRDSTRIACLDRWRTGYRQIYLDAAVSPRCAESKNTLYLRGGKRAADQDASRTPIAERHSKLLYPNRDLHAADL